MGNEEKAFGPTRERRQTIVPLTTREIERKRTQTEVLQHDSHDSSSTSMSGRRKTFTLKSKQLPKDFAN